MESASIRLTRSPSFLERLYVAVRMTVTAAVPTFAFIRSLYWCGDPSR